VTLKFQLSKSVEFGPKVSYMHPWSSRSWIGHPWYKASSLVGLAHTAEYYLEHNPEVN